MTARNNSTIGIFLRITDEHHAHLAKKALKNPDNRHNFLAREIKDLIEKDLNESKAKKVALRK